MAITAEQFAATVAGTEDANGLDLPFTPPAAPANEQNQQQQNNATPPAEATPPAAPNTEPAPATPPAPVFNLDEELVKTTNGAIKSKDDLAALLSRANKATELETQLSNYNELKAKAEADPFANDFTKKLNDLYKGGANESQIKAFMTINSVPDLDTLTPLQASALALQVKHGLSPEDANTYLANKYKIDPENPGVIPDKNDEIALKIESTADRDFLKTHKAEVSQAPANQAAIDQAKQEQLLQQQYTEQIAKLNPIASQVVGKVLTDSFKGVSLNGKEDDTAIRTDLPISEESKANLAQIATDMVASNWNTLTPDEKGQEAIKTFTDNVIILQNWKNWLIDVASKTELRVRAEYTNASPINRGQAAPPLGKTQQQQRADTVTRALQEAGEL